LSEQAVESCEKDQTLTSSPPIKKFAFEVLKVDATPTFFDQWRDTQRRDVVRGVGRKAQSAAEELALASDLPAAWPYVGGCNSLTSQPTSPDFIGSDAIAIFST
jgi:hypothetical protein